MDASDPQPPRDQAASADRLIAAAARAADGARARLSGAINDLFRPIDNRLSDREHALMTRMLPALIDEIEGFLRRAIVAEALLPDPVNAELADPAVPIALPRLARSRILRDADLAALMLRRCDEHYLAGRLQQAYPATGGALDRLSSHDDQEIRRAVAALMVEESRRVDSFGDPLVRLADTPLEVLHRLGWWIAAMLRDYLVDRTSDDLHVEQAIARAVGRLVADSDPGAAVEAHALRLAILLERAGLLDDALLSGLQRDGQVLLWTACLSLRSGVELPNLAAMLADPDASRLTLLLRAVGLERVTALGMLAALFAVRMGSRAENDLRLAEAAAAYDALDCEKAEAALRPWVSVSAGRRDG